jgi:hypothetical protein
MINSPTKGALMALAFVALSGVFSEARALQNCTGKCEAGYQACTTWCTDHNKTAKSRELCDIRCGDYWLSGRNPQSIGPSNPTGSPTGRGQITPLPKGNP